MLDCISLGNNHSKLNKYLKKPIKVVNLSKNIGNEVRDQQHARLHKFGQ